MSWTVSWVACVVLAGADMQGSSVAVPMLKPAQGVTPETAGLLTGALVNKLRATGRFSRVVSAQEIEGVLGYEQQKQLMTCDSGSCMAELAGSLGVTYVLTGSMGRVGSQWLLNLSLMDTRNGQSAASVTKSAVGTDEGALLPMLDQVAQEMAAKVPGGTSPAAAATVAAPAPSAPAAAPAAAPAEAPARGGMLGKVLKGVGAASLAAGALTVPVGLAGAGLAAGLFALVFMDPGFTYGAGLGVPIGLGYYGGLGVLATSVVLGLVALGAGAGMLAAGFVL